LKKIIEIHKTRLLLNPRRKANVMQPVLKVIWGQTDQWMDQPTDQPINIVSYRGATLRLKRFRKKMALIKTDYEEGRLQPTPAGHPQLAIPLFLSPHDI
jgi:hypothetical protein